LDAVIRKDYWAESRAPWGSWYANNYNGFFIREDVFSTETTDILGIHTSTFLNNHELNYGLTSSDDVDNPNIPKGSPAYIHKIIDNYYDATGAPTGNPPPIKNAMSQDEAIGLLLGMALVHKCAKGTTADDKAKDITDKVISYIRNNNYSGLINAVGDWIIRDPYSNPVPQGQDARLYAYGFAKAGVYIVRPHKGINHYLTFFGRKFRKLLWDADGLFTCNPTPCNPPPGWMVKLYKKHHGLRQKLAWYMCNWCNSSNLWMESVLGAIGNSWGSITPVPIALKTATSNWTPFYLFLYSVLHNKNAYLPFTPFAEDLINKAPCYGPYCYCPDNTDPEGCHPSDFSPNGWGTSLRFTHDMIAQTHGEQIGYGGFSGVDYMLLYNLYNIIYANDLPPYINCSDRTLSGTLPLLPAGIGTNNNPQTYNVIHSIESTQIINNATPSTNSGNITYRAGYSISLMPGFSVNAGATFWAHIQKFDICTDNDPLTNQIDEELKIVTPPPVDSTLCGTLYYCNSTKPVPYDTILLVENGVPIFEHIDTMFIDTIVINDTTYIDTLSIDSTFLVNGLSIVTDDSGRFCFEETDLMELDDSINYAFTTTSGAHLSPYIYQTIEDWINASPITLYLNCGDQKYFHPTNQETPPSNILVKVYPNPNNGSWEVEYNFSDGLDGHFELYDVTGRKIKDYLLFTGKNKLSINESELLNGTYTYQVIHNNAIVAKDKLVIIKN